MNTPTLTGTYTCTHHNDQQRAACPVCLVATLTAERDQLRAEVERWQGTAAKMSEEREHNANEASRLRAEVERLTPYVSKAILTHGGTMLCSPQVGVAFNEMRARANARAERAEAELAKERARLDWLLLDNLTRFDDSISHRTAIDAAMKEGEK